MPPIILQYIMYNCAISLPIQLSYSGRTDGMCISEDWPPGRAYIGVKLKDSWLEFNFSSFVEPLYLLLIRLFIQDCSI